MLLHVVVVLSIVRQPLSVAERPAERSLTWPLHFDTVHRGGPGIDFFAVYHGGVNLEAERSPYEMEEPGPRTPYYYPYRYLPVVAATLGRVAQELPPLLASRLWIVVLEASLMGFVWCLWTRYRSLGAVAALLLSTPYFLELHMGQFTFFCTVAALGAGLLLDGGGERSRRWLGGVALTVSFLLKVFPLAVLPALLRFRTAARVAALCVTATVVLGGAHFLATPSDWAPFYERNFSRPLGGMDSGNHSPLYVILLVGAKLGIAWNEGNWFPLVSAVRWSALGGAALLVLSTRQRSLVSLMSLLLLAHFASYSHYWEHHASAVVAIGAALLCCHEGRPTARRDRAERWLLGLALALLVLPTPYALLPGTGVPSLTDPGARWQLGTKLLLAASKGLPTLVLFGVCVAGAVRAGLRWPLAKHSWWLETASSRES